jgi:hypothetical protein
MEKQLAFAVNSSALLVVPAVAFVLSLVMLHIKEIRERADFGRLQAYRGTRPPRITRGK